MPASDSPVKELETKCAEGDAEALYALGKMLVCGEEIPKNSAKGRKYLTDASNAGDIRAMSALVDYYMDEKPEEWIKFVEYWLRKAIQGGDDTAIIRLADFYYLGDGDSNKNAALLYLESAKKDEDDCEREVGILTRMLESGWLEPEWKFYGEVLELLADNGNREAKHLIRRDEVPEPEDDFDYDALLSETYELPEVVYEEKAKPVRRWGRSTVGKRALTSILYDMGIEFTKTSNGIIKTKKGEEIREDIQKLIDRGYKFKYSYKTDKWTIMDKTGKE